jgi:nucleotidyltransferase/DNA polymerase involved in DNA repair
MVACALITRFPLLVALGERRKLLARPVALAPEPDAPQVVGEVSGAAEAYGIHAGMRLGEALARCPGLGLVPPDLVRAEEEWEAALRSLEGIGASVESDRPGEAFFEAEGLRPLWGGSIEGVLARSRKALTRPVRLGAGSTRLCAYAAALRARPRRGPVIVPVGAGRPFLASQPVGLLRERLPDEWDRVNVPDTLERLGVRTLGELAALPVAAVADRFGDPGLRALRMARGEEEPLRPRRRHEDLAERLELPDGYSGQQLEQALVLLIDRLLANPARRDRSLRRLRLGARLAGGGSWRAEVALRRASAERERLRLALVPKLGEMSGPASALHLRAIELGPVAHDQPTLSRSPDEQRHARLAEAVRQARAAAGREAVMLVLEVDPDSRVPERRAVLTPFPEGGDR